MVWEKEKDDDVARKGILPSSSIKVDAHVHVS